MQESVHRYLCPRCHSVIFGDNPTRLAANANTHAQVQHPADFSSWTPSGITKSAHYVSPPGQPRPQYLLPHGTTSKSEWGDARNAPYITDEDRDILLNECGGVIW